MTLEEADARIDRLEGLLKLSMCVCKLGPTSYMTAGCPFHGFGAISVPYQQIMEDRSRWGAWASGQEAERERE